MNSHAASYHADTLQSFSVREVISSGTRMKHRSHTGAGISDFDGTAIGCHSAADKVGVEHGSEA